MTNVSSVSTTLCGHTRLDILEAARFAGNSGAHIAPSLSLVEIVLSVLCRFDEHHDAFVLSKGHGALGYYASMHQLGMITDEQFATFESNGGEFPGQPSRSADNKVQYNSGSLGMGLSYGLGLALAKKGKAGTVYVVLGDGELGEGSNWEAVALSKRYGLDNLVAIVDANGLQSDGKCEDVMGLDLEALWRAHGWRLITCDGHSPAELDSAMGCEHEGLPLAIVARTVKGKGVSFMENNNAWHHATLSESDCSHAIEEVRRNYGL